MLNPRVVVPESGPIQRFFNLLWYQKLDTYIDYQGGEGLLGALVITDLLARWQP